MPGVAPIRSQMYRQGGILSPGVTSVTLTSLVQQGTGTYPNWDNIPPPGGTALDFPTAIPGKIVSASKRMDQTPRVNIDGGGVTGHNVDGLLPPGSMIMFGGITAPLGWLLCDGTAISRALYPDLAAALWDGTKYVYGNGDGSTTFNLPPFNDRVPRGNTLVPTGGSDTVTMPDHTHGLAAHIHGLGVATSAAVPTGTGGGQRLTGGNTGIASPNETTAVIGTNPSIGNVPSFVGVRIIIKV